MCIRDRKGARLCARTHCCTSNTKRMPKNSPGGEDNIPSLKKCLPYEWKPKTGTLQEGIASKNKTGRPPLIPGIPHLGDQATVSFDALRSQGLDGGASSFTRDTKSATWETRNTTAAAGCRAAPGRAGASRSTAIHSKFDRCNTTLH